ncbi:dienelactone hydrolase family protein [Sphingomonas sp. S6]|jgi:carboxymethylenebutenolidase|uniref:dienelactone hydrolase family protein n=1 Tax=Sphingomonas sp. S6 TaxID=3368600 RepID=UPI000FA67C73|nr:dienelactone hydrolase family protein [uncultured Sphingomonas sp.]RTL14437.1 MAG: dienelactone hydrolase family protein [Sphingomonadaceae bacterium]
MCDEITEADNATHLTRRQLGASAGAVGMAALLPTSADAKPVKGRDVTITTPDGQCDAYFTAPASGKHPGVLMWPDIMGLRPAFRQMADRLAGEGYAVLVVNQFYRSTKSPIVQPGESFDQPAVRDKIMPWRAALTADAVTRDGTTFVAFLDKQKEVDTKRHIGSAGYCMGGPMVLRTAAAVSNRVHAGASFHGAGLVSEAADSPHRLIPKLAGGYLIAIASNDDARSPNDKTVLHDAFAAAKRPADIQVYADAMHGWCVIDSKVYNQPQAERAWGRMLDLFRKQL